MRKTKIICTLGPSTDKGDVLEKLMLSGMNVFLMILTRIRRKE